VKGFENPWPELPAPPNLEQLKNQASPETVSTTVALHDAQSVIAREHGFALQHGASVDAVDATFRERRSDPRAPL